MKWVSRLALALGAPTILLLALEFGLRALGFGASYDFALRRTQDGASMWINNPQFAHQFFPPQLNRESLPFALPVEKPQDEYRVFVLGGSAALGVPEPAYGIPRALQLMLQEARPNAHVNVVNVAITAINSHVVYPIARACAEMSPDLFVIYMGNNEVVGPYGAGTVFAPIGENIEWIRFNLWLRGTRLGQLVHGALGQRDSGLPQTWRGMEMFLENQVPADDPRLDTVYANYRRNLDDILALAEDREIPVLLGSAAVNLKDCPPFGSTPGPDSAQSHFDRARELLATGRAQEALPEFERARDLDTLRFRCDSALQSIPGELATARAGVTFVDTARAVATASPHSIPGDELLYEHVHFNPRGNYVVARSFYESWAHTQTSAVPPLDFATVQERLALGPWAELQLLEQMLDMMSKPPFTSQSGHADRFAQLQSEYAQVAGKITATALTDERSRYESALEYNDHWMLRFRFADFLHRGLAEPRPAAELWSSVEAEFPWFAAVKNHLGEAVAGIGEYERARTLIESSLALNPHQAHAHNNLANCVLALNAEDPAHQELAHQHYRRAIELKDTPQFRRNWNLLRNRQARGHIQKGELDLAAPLLRDAIAHEETNAEARYNLAYLLAQSGEHREARGHLEILQQAHPENPQVRELLSSLDD